MDRRKVYWFRRTWIGTATPIHPTGALTLFGGMGVALATGYFANWLLDHGHSGFGTVLFATFAVGILWLIIFISVKTEPRG